MKKLLLGLILIFLDVNYLAGTIYIGVLPTFLGYFLLYQAMTELAEDNPRFAKLRPVCNLLTVAEAFAWSCNLLGVPALLELPYMMYAMEVVLTLPVFIVSGVILTGLYDIEKENKEEFGMGKIFASWGVLVVCQTVAAILFIVPESKLATLLTMGALVLMVTAIIAHLAFLYTALQNYDAMKKRLAKEREFKAEKNQS